MKKSLEEIKNSRDYEESFGEEYECVSKGCTKKGVGILYYWCGDPECCSPPTAYLCEEHLVEVYG